MSAMKKWSWISGIGSNEYRRTAVLQNFKKMYEPCQKKIGFARNSPRKMVSDMFKKKQGSQVHVPAGKVQRTRF